MSLELQPTANSKLRSRSKSPQPAPPESSTVEPFSIDSESDDDIAIPELTPRGARSTKMPSSHQPDDDARPEDYEPLLGQPGDTTQPREKSLGYNTITGTAILAQAGIWILVATVWAASFMHPLMLFSAHPMLNSFALLAGTQAVLLLQPTYTPAQKRSGALAHASFNGLAFLAYLAGLIVIEYNKFDHGGTHFVSIHAILGLTTYILLLLQSLVGFTMYFVPSLYGSVDAAKSIWKYHRMSGYLVLTLALATVCAAMETDYNLNVLGIELWVMIVSSVLILLGLLPRVKLQKLGLKSMGRQ